MSLKFYRLVIDEDDDGNVHEISLSLTNNDGDIKNEVGLQGAKKLFGVLVDNIDKRLRSQKPNVGPVRDTRPAYPYGYPDSQIN